MASSEQSKKGEEFVLTSRVEKCLDYANTLAYRGSTPVESLRDFADLLKWISEVKLLPSRLAHQLRDWSEKHPKRAADAFAEAIALRELIYRVFHALASGKKPDQTDLGLLNRALRDAPERVVIQRAEEGFGWQIEESKPSACSMIAPVLWSAADLLVGPEFTRLRECSNDKCLWLFLDDSKNGTRRWCSMQACGNRAKAHRHYLRQKGGGASA